MGLRQRSKIKNPALFFVTTSTLHNKRLFESKENLEKIENILFRTSEEKQGYLMGYVIMPSHLHLLIAFNDGGPGLSRFMLSLKGRIRKDLFGNRRIWQSRFDDLELISERQFGVKLEYVHNNPVKAGLAKSQFGWRFSSAKAWKERVSDTIRFDFKWQE